MSFVICDLLYEGALLSKFVLYLRQIYTKNVHLCKGGMLFCVLGMLQCVLWQRNK